MQKLEALIGGDAGGDYSKYGKPISAADVYEGNTSISDTDCVARMIYAEQTGITEDQNAVAIEIYNRLHDTARVGKLSKKNPATLRSIVFYPSAYAVIRDKVSNRFQGLGTGSWLDLTRQDFPVIYNQLTKANRVSSAR